MATIRKRDRTWQVPVRRLGQQLVTRTFQRKADAEVWAGLREAEADEETF
jgi:hypothetical protein